MPYNRLLLLGGNALDQETIRITLLTLIPPLDRQYIWFHSYPLPLRERIMPNDLECIIKLKPANAEFCSSIILCHWPLVAAATLDLLKFKLGIPYKNSLVIERLGDLTNNKFNKFWKQRSTKTWIT